MKVLVKPIGESDGNFQLSASALLHVVGKALQWAVVTAWTYMSARHEAWVAEELDRSLSRLSNAELARRGLDRQQLAYLVKENLG